MRRKREAGGAAHLASASRYPEQPAPHPGKRETVGKPIGSVASSDNGAKMHGTCPVCRRPKLDVTRKPSGGHWVSCWSCEANGLTGRAFLSALLDAIGAKPNQGGQLLHEGPAFEALRPWLDRAAPASRAVSSYTLGHVRGWASALFMEDGASALAYLTERRGLSLDVLRQYGVGWDRERGDLTFPIFDADGAPEYLLRRKPVDGAKVIANGSPRPVYPNVPARGPLCLVEGEIDALTGRQMGLRTVALGGKKPPPKRLSVLAGRMASVLFDVGADEAAERVVQLLRAAGGTAWVVRLARLGLSEDEDLNDYHREGGSIAELRQLIAIERRTR